MRIRVIIALGFLACPFLGTIGNLFAQEPVAPVAKLKSTAEPLLKAQGKTIDDLKKYVPTKTSVGLPIYPNVYYASTITADGMLSTVNLVSPDSVERVVAWYKENLEGWTYNEMMGGFFEGTGDLKLSEVFGKPGIMILEETGQALDLIFWDVPDAKTRIQIIYEPKEQ